jgi:N-acetylneuraminic acid mutarotase
MKTGRFCAPITLLKDNFILAAGGQTKNQVKKYTNSVEIFDISKNEWSTLNSMQRPRGNTSLTAINDRFVYIFNGLSSPNI